MGLTPTQTMAVPRVSGVAWLVQSETLMPPATTLTFCDERKPKFVLPSQNNGRVNGVFLYLDYD